MMFITVNFKFKRNEIPPKCRKPRDVFYPGAEIVEIVEVTSDAAPVAIKVFDRDYDQESETWMEKDEIRFWNGRLYTRQKWSNDRYRDEKISELPNLGPGTDYIEEYEAREGINERAQSFLIIDSEIWHVTKEPVYVIHRYMSKVGVVLSTDLGYDTNKPHWLQFRADELDLAKQIALSLANGQDDRWGGPYTKYEVLMPQALKAPAYTKLVRAKVTFEVEVTVQFGDDMDDAAKAAFQQLQTAKHWRELSPAPKVEQSWGGTSWSELRDGQFGERKFTMR